MKLRRLFLGLFMSLALVVTFIPMIAFGEEGDMEEAVMHKLVFEGDCTIQNDGEVDYVVFGEQEEIGEIYAPFDGDTGMLAAEEGAEVNLYVNAFWGWAVKSVKYSLDDGQNYIDVEWNDQERAYQFILPVCSEMLEFDDVTIKVEFESAARTVSIEGATAAYDTYDGGEGYYYASLDHGYVYGLEYDEAEEEFYGIAGDKLYLYVEPDEGYYIDSVVCSAGDGNVDVEADYYGSQFAFKMPNKDVTIKVIFKEGENPYIPSDIIDSIDLTIKAPVLGTEVEGDDYVNGGDMSGVRQIPQPEASVPDGAKYELDGNQDKNYGLWLIADEDWWETFEGTIQCGDTYIAEIWLRSKADDVVFVNEDECNINVKGATFISYELENSHTVRIYSKIKFEHKWRWDITDSAGFLKNGSKIQYCTECGDYGNTAVVPGYAKYFVKGLKVKKGKKSFTVKWKKQSKKNLKQFNGYQIMYSTKADMSGAKTVNASKKAKSKTIKKLKKKTTYYVKVCTFTKKGGVTYYSNWSPVKKVKTK